MIIINTVYTFKDFIIDLSNRREFDIIVYNEKYGISWFGGGKISFAKYGDQSFLQYFDSIDDFRQNARINNNLLSMIWEDVEVDVMY
ncbi:hypothetical protein [Clostridium saccharoperbutylacetonicum]|uniref:hypothetical protein n=1 Tax=Clostridium saccharoperbutylacetonicum TaxID=36745 RepID=UPI000983EB27|nr:hypothetical protein [Clostridium saccharoperbutylacetonicum]AQR93151.1 hypothetical protein CLSAP_04280 [Clostridium saccharoperbutylacetonicum]NSB34567.1 hypothetical protein [Clostridium saccharoperbutylacetonicum]